LKKRIILGSVIIFISLIAALSINSNPTVEGAGDPEIKKIIFIDKYRPTHAPTPGADDPGACSNTSDNFKTIAGGIKWKKFPVKYYIDSSGVSGVTSADAKQAVRDSFDVWDIEEHGGKKGNLFEETTNPSEAKITVMWSPLDGSGGTLGVANISYKPQGKEIISVLIQFDSQDSWNIFNTIVCGNQGVNVFDIADVAVHEIGHALGFDHVSANADLFNTEFPAIIYFGETHKVTLGAGEKIGLKFLYKGGGSDDDGGTGSGGKCPPGKPNHPKC